MHLPLVFYEQWFDSPLDPLRIIAVLLYIF